MLNPAGHQGKTQQDFIIDLWEGSKNEQRAALDNLAIIGDADALDEVVSFLRDNPEYASGALKSINILVHKYFPESRYDLADVILPYLKSKSWFQRLTVVRIFNTHPNELATEGLLELIEEGLERIEESSSKRISFSRSQIEQTIGEAVTAIANCGKSLVLPDMLRYLENRHTRLAAVRGLGIIGLESERLRLEELAEDRSTRIRDAAQWSLALMDDRKSQLDIPPDKIPEPPPDRLSPIYYTHRQLTAAEDEMEQLLIVRVAIEHLILDTFIKQGRALDTCQIVLREYKGSELPEAGSKETSTLKGLWLYRWHGPRLKRISRDEPDLPVPNKFFTKGNWPGPVIAIYYPENLMSEGEGRIGTHLFFDPHYGRGAEYQMTEINGNWIFSRYKKTWST